METKETTAHSFALRRRPFLKHKAQRATAELESISKSAGCRWSSVSRPGPSSRISLDDTPGILEIVSRAQRPMSRLNDREAARVCAALTPARPRLRFGNPGNVTSHCSALKRKTATR